MELVRHERQNGVSIITLNNPRELNALSTTLLRELDGLIQELCGDAALRVIIVTGEGKAFCAGANIAEMKDYNRAEAEEYSRFGNSVMERLSTAPMPVIAAVNGYALGGGLELALACDIRLASEKAKLGFPEVKLGIMPGFGGTQRLSRLIGASKAMELIFTADNLSAEQALAYGIINKVYEHDSLMPEALALAAKIAGNSAVGVRQAKRAIKDGASVALDRALEIETAAFGECFEHEDQKQAMNAFLNKGTGGKNE